MAHVDSVFCFDEFELDCRTGTLRHGGEAVHVDARILRLLEVFVRNPGRLITKDQLIEQVWTGRFISDNALTVALSRLRKMLREHGMPGESVLTEYGHGYRFTRRVTASNGEAAPDGVAELSRPGFVGRKREMLQLTAALAAAQAGRGSLVALRGEPGIGKTLLAEVFAELAVRSGCAVAWGCCHQLGNAPPLWPFVELLRGVASQARAASGGYPGSALLAASSGAPPGNFVLDFSGQLDNLGSKHRIFDAIAHTLSVAARATPQVLILDDLQHADDATVEMLRYLLDNIARTHIVLIVTARRLYGHDSKRESQLAALNHRNCIRVALEPLSRADVASYIDTHCGAIDSALVEAVYELSQGNPLCMRELVRQLRESGTLDAAKLTLPKLARELLAQRFTTLDADTREILTFASVIGSVFGLPLLASVTGHDAGTVMRALDSACAAEIVHPVASSATLFEFKNGLLRAAAYDAQSASERRLRHLRVLQSLEQRRALVVMSCAEFAFHSRAALPDSDPRRTVDYCCQAASAAEQVYAFGDAIRHLKDARETLDLLSDVSPRERFQLLFRLALLVRAHSAREFSGLADELLRLARELGPADVAATSLLLDPLPGFPRVPITRAAVADALAALPEGATNMRPALMARLASSVPLAQTASASYAQIEQALALAQRSPHVADRVSAHFDELYLYGGPEHRARAMSTLTALQRLYNESEQVGPLDLTRLDLHRALTALQHGDVATASRALDRSEQRCRKLDGELSWHLQRLRAFIQINLGKVTEGRTQLFALHRRARCCADSSNIGLFCVYDRHLPLSTTQLGDVPHALLAPDPHDPPNIWALKLRTLEQVGALDEARSALELVPAERLGNLPCDREFLGCMGALARTALRLQAHAYTRIIYERLSPYPECFAVNLSGYCEGSVSLLLGMLARSIGDLDRALLHFEAATIYSDQAEFARSAAEARLEQSRCASVRAAQ